MRMPFMTVPSKSIAPGGKNVPAFAPFVFVPRGPSYSDSDGSGTTTEIPQQGGSHPGFQVLACYGSHRM